jgi:hypothetical protein
MEYLKRIFYTKQDFEGMQIYMLLRIGRVIGSNTMVTDTRQEIIEKLCTALDIK